jgi:Cft2 family RNA processing exonuclease
VTRDVTWDRGISLPAHSLWLDPLTVRDLAVVSHAHADHARRHRQAVLTQATLALLAPERRPRDPCTVPFETPVRLGGCTATLYPAGHMLGAAQVLISYAGETLLYSGDLKLRRGAAHGKTFIPHADVLVLESTYGELQFRFPDPDTVLEAIAMWCRRCLDTRVTPVLLAHATGKAQELMVALSGYGFSFALEERCLAYSEAYERAGMTLPDHVALSDDAGGRVVLAPPTGKAAIRRLARYRTALVSGWAADREFRRVFGADVAFPLSDHCDFDELLEVARAAGAGKVYTVHGFSLELAAHMRRRGIRACALQQTEQLALAI